MRKFGEVTAFLAEWFESKGIDRPHMKPTLGWTMLSRDEMRHAERLASGEHDTQADEEFSADTSGRSPWWSCPGEQIDRVFVVLPQSRQTMKFDQLSRLRWLYRLALGQPHQQDFIETVMQMPSDGREEYVLSLSAWPHVAIAGAGGAK